MQTLCLHQRPRFLRDLSPVRVSDLSAKPSKHGHENSLASAKRKCMHESIQRVHRKQQLCMRVGGLCAVRASAISISRLSTHACKKRAKATVSGEQKKDMSRTNVCWMGAFGKRIYGNVKFLIVHLLLPYVNLFARDHLHSYYDTRVHAHSHIEPGGIKPRISKAAGNCLVAR